MARGSRPVYQDLSRTRISRCFADRFNRSLVSSAAQARGTILRLRPRGVKHKEQCSNFEALLRINNGLKR